MSLHHSIFNKIKNNPENNWQDWKWQIKHSFSSIDEVFKTIIPFQENENISQVEKKFFTRVNPYYLSLAQKWNLQDPIIMQALPNNQELNDNNINLDPLAEHEYSPVDNLVHRYPDRCLAILTGFCATLCRHCMRKRNWLEPDASSSKQQLYDMIQYIKQTPKIREVIVTGGDPLLINEHKLDFFLEELCKIPTVEIIRIGTRVPVVIPQRITPSLCTILKKRQPIWIATHFNHPLEITNEAKKACQMLHQSGCYLINQTVLMKGINDDAETIRQLGTKLLTIGVKPHYLFHMDPVGSTGHFKTGIKKGLEIIEQLRGFTSSLAIPTFAIDLPHGGGKVPLMPNYQIGKSMQFKSYDGRIINY